MRISTHLPVDTKGNCLDFKGDKRCWGGLVLSCSLLCHLSSAEQESCLPAFVPKPSQAPSNCTSPCVPFSLAP
jgi:hypothetical protein